VEKGNRRKAQLGDVRQVLVRTKEGTKINKIKNYLNNNNFIKNCIKFFSTK